MTRAAAASARSLAALGPPGLVGRAVHDRPARAVARVPARVRVAEHRAAGPARPSPRRGRASRRRPRSAAARRACALSTSSSITNFSGEKQLNDERMPAACSTYCAPVRRTVSMASADSMPAWASGRCASVTEPPARTGHAQPVAEPHGGLHERPVRRRADHERAALHRRERRGAAVEERRSPGWRAA